MDAQATTPSAFGIDEGTGLPLRPLPAPHAVPGKGILKVRDVLSSACRPGDEESSTRRLKWIDAETAEKLWTTVVFSVENGAFRQKLSEYRGKNKNGAGDHRPVRMHQACAS